MPYKKPSGRKAMKCLRIYSGHPHQFEGKKIMLIEDANRQIRTKYITVGDLAKSIGWNN